MIKLSYYSGKRIAVLGLGRSGLSVINSLLESNAEFVLGIDDKIEALKINHHDKYAKHIKEGRLKLINSQSDNILANNLIEQLVLSPGIPVQPKYIHPIIIEARDLGIDLISDLDLLYLHQPQANYIGITGTNGKSTTTMLISHFLKSTLRSGDIVDDLVQVGGNIGIPVLELQPLVTNNNYADTNDKYYVLELSSFQLDISKYLAIDIAICLNITPDHLDRYINIMNYATAKEKIFHLPKALPQNINNIELKSAIKIISLDYIETKLIYKRLIASNKKEKIIPISIKKQLPQGISIINGELTINKVNNIDHYQENISYLLPLPLRGRHNAENLSAALAGCLSLGIPLEAILKAIPTFIGLPHRMQLVAENSNLLFINDSKATNVDSTRYALENFSNIHWIAGGISKDQGIECLANLFYRIESAYLIGESTNDFATILARYGVKHVKCYTLEQALMAVKQNARKGVALLSPACSSLDQWNNFEERGIFFINKVKELWNLH